MALQYFITIYPSDFLNYIIIDKILFNKLPKFEDTFIQETKKNNMQFNNNSIIEKAKNNFNSKEWLQLLEYFGKESNQ